MVATHRYLSVQNTTASKERLMVNLFQIVLRHMRNGAKDLEAKQVSKASRALDKAAQIVGYLQGTLNRATAPTLVDQLSEIYTFTAARLCRDMGAALPRRFEHATGARLGPGIRAGTACRARRQLA